jgi:hypothetical protein
MSEELQTRKQRLRSLWDRRQELQMPELRALVSLLEEFRAEHIPVFRTPEKFAKAIEKIKSRLFVEELESKAQQMPQQEMPPQEMPEEAKSPVAPPAAPTVVPAATERGQERESRESKQANEARKHARRLCAQLLRYVDGKKLNIVQLLQLNDALSFFSKPKNPVRMKLHEAVARIEEGTKEKEEKEEKGEETWKVGEKRCGVQRRSKSGTWYSVSPKSRIPEDIKRKVRDCKERP